MVTLSYDEYDKETEIFEKIRESGKVPVYWPTVPQIDGFWKNPKKWIRFCCYLYECNPEPKNSEERYSRKNLSVFLQKNLELSESTTHD